MVRIVRKHPGCGFAPDKDCEGLEAASKSTTSERAIPSWDRLGEEGEPSWRWEILRGICRGGVTADAWGRLELGP